MGINGGQLGILDSIFDIYFETINELSDDKALSVYNLILSKDEITMSKQIWLIRHNIWTGTVRDINDVIKHPKPHEANHKSKNARGALNLSTWNDDKDKDIKPVTKQDVLNYIYDKCKAYKNKLLNKQVKAAEIEELNQWMCCDLLKNKKYIDLCENGRIEFKKLYNIYISENAPKKMEVLNSKIIFQQIIHDFKNFDNLYNLLIEKKALKKAQLLIEPETIKLYHSKANHDSNKGPYEFNKILNLAKNEKGKIKIKALAEKEAMHMVYSNIINADKLYEIVTSENGGDKVLALAKPNISYLIKHHDACNMDQLLDILDIENGVEKLNALSTNNMFFIINRTNLNFDIIHNLLNRKHGLEKVKIIASDEIYNLIAKDFCNDMDILRLAYGKQSLEKLNSLAQSYNLLVDNKISFAELIKLLNCADGMQKVNLLNSHFITKLIEFEELKQNDLSKSISMIKSIFNFQKKDPINIIIDILNSKNGVAKVELLNSSKIFYLVTEQYLNLNDIAEILQSEKGFNAIEILNKDNIFKYITINNMPKNEFEHYLDDLINNKETTVTEEKELPDSNIMIGENSELIMLE